jgi:probable rRNA maturation factor
MRKNQKKLQASQKHPFHKKTSVLAQTLREHPILTLTMIVYIENLQKDLSINVNQVERLACQVVDYEGLSFDEVSIQFVDTQQICSLHEEYFDDPTTTDCISFPMDHEDSDFDHHKVLGDVIICPKTAIDYAQTHKNDTYEEVTLYIIHGLLHLMGYKDLEDSDIKKMRLAEERHMKNLKTLDLCLHA